MVISPYLVVTENGGCRITKTYPRLEWHEIAIQLHLNIPDELYRKPQLSASISVDPKAVQTPEIGCEVISNIEEAIKQHTGVEVKLSVVSEEKE